MSNQYINYQVIRRNGDVVNFDIEKINIALNKAYIATYGDDLISFAIRDKISKLIDVIGKFFLQTKPNGGIVNIEEIQDRVELTLMRNGEYEVAKNYILYRDNRNKERVKLTANNIKIKINIIDYNEKMVVLNELDLMANINNACYGLKNTNSDKIFQEVLKNIYDGINYKELTQSLIFASRQLIEYEPEYNFVTARLLLQSLIIEVIGQRVNYDDMKNVYCNYLFKYIELGVNEKLLSPKLKEFDIELLANAIDFKKDYKFKYLGLQTLYDRYFLHINSQRIELPQIFFMRVAMGLAINEVDKNNKAIEFYELLSNFDFMSSTPTLFNAGTTHSQLSSCYLTTVDDDLANIYESIKDNALLSKFAGGLGNDWSYVRGMGAVIKGTNGKSQGVIPFLKVVNDTAVAVNQGGKRKGAVCVYLETWHIDIEEFLELRKNTGDDRRRCHDMNTANWIPDLFMKRVINKELWTLFSPNEVKGLHDSYGKDFVTNYLKYEQMAQNGQIKNTKTINAIDLWRKILSMLFETGHPWITFKDPCNIRSPQQHVGVIHSSNLCTEITLNTNSDEIAVCNLGSINLVNHIDTTNKTLDVEKIQRTIKTAMRMLDNVIDINFYPVKKAETSNKLHRPVGIGMMGFQDVLYQLNIAYASDEAVSFADYSTELITYYAYLSSNELAIEKGKYQSYDGSLWSQGILPLDSINALINDRGKEYTDIDQSSILDWSILRENIKKHGMRNSNCVAIAPTATIANIVGVGASIEPTYQNIFVKSNLSGEFTIVNEYLINALKQHNLWDSVMLSDIKYFDGSLANIDRIPNYIKELYKTAFEVNPAWLIKCASRRQKWIDQAQSLNIYVATPSGKVLDEIYKLAWVMGLKTTYYLRTLAATSVEKSTGNGGELNAISDMGVKNNNYQINTHTEIYTETSIKLCNIDDQECESCQ